MPLKIHFLNVGQGDCTIIEFPSGRVGMVDVNNLDCLDATTEEELSMEYFAESIRAMARGQAGPGNFDEFRRQQYAPLTDPLVYYKKHLGTRDIFRMIITHPDMDHMSGLHRLHVQEPSIALLNFWHTGSNNFEMDESDWKNCPYDERDWTTYKSLRDGSEPRSLQQSRGNSGDYWTDDGVELWSPTPALEKLAVDRGEKNILSMVLKISYAGRTVVLGGDATADETWPDIMKTGAVGRVSVLKASHHGRHTGYHQPAVKSMSPWLTITSVGTSEHDATEKYRQYSDHTVSLRKAGDVTVEIHEDGRWYYSPNVADYWKDKL